MQSVQEFRSQHPDFNQDQSAALDEIVDAIKTKKFRTDF